MLALAFIFLILWISFTPSLVSDLLAFRGRSQIMSATEGGGGGFKIADIG